jgi:hypothetical protein
MLDLDGLPGADLVRRGIADLEHRRDTVEALLVAIGWPRLERAGLELPPRARELHDTEILLYTEIGRDRTCDAYARYGALLRELVSFERALERQVRSSEAHPHGAGGAASSARSSHTSLRRRNHGLKGGS